MNDKTQATEPSDAELRALWQQAGGTFFSANRETGSMPAAKLVPFLRHLMGPEAVVIHEPAPAPVLQVLAGTEAASAAPAPTPATPDSGYAAMLVKLVSAVCPGLDTGNLLEDARLAIAAMTADAQLVGYFGIDDEPLTDGSARYLQIGSQYKADEDVFPLYRRAPRKGEPVEAPAASSAAGATSTEKPATARARGGNGQGAKGGAS